MSIIQNKKCMDKNCTNTIKNDLKDVGIKNHQLSKITGTR